MTHIFDYNIIMVIMDFHNLYAIHVFKVEEFTVDILTELPCLSDLENPSQLPVRKVLMKLSYKLLRFSDFSWFRGQGIHCWYFYRASLFELPRKSRSTSGSMGTSKVLIIVSYEFSKFLHYLCFRGRWNPLLTFLLSYDVWVTSII